MSTNGSFNNLVGHEPSRALLSWAQASSQISLLRLHPYLPTSDGISSPVIFLYEPNTKKYFTTENILHWNKQSINVVDEVTISTQRWIYQIDFFYDLIEGHLARSGTISIKPISLQNRTTWRPNRFGWTSCFQYPSDTTFLFVNLHIPVNFGCFHEKLEWIYKRNSQNYNFQIIKY
jgi:hypothetical protein